MRKSLLSQDFSQQPYQQLLQKKYPTVSSSEGHWLRCTVAPGSVERHYVPWAYDASNAFFCIKLNKLDPVGIIHQSMGIRHKSTEIRHVYLQLPWILDSK